MKKLTTVFAIISLLAATSIAQAAVLIDTSFEASEGWAVHTQSSASLWTDDTTWGTFTAYRTAGTPNTYIQSTSGNARSGSYSGGFNSVGQYLELPAKNKPGKFSIYYRSTATTLNAWTVTVQTNDGTTWVSAGNFSAAGTAYQQYSVDVPINEDNQVIRYGMTARTANSCYFDDLMLTDIPEPLFVSLIVAGLILFGRRLA